MDMRTLKVGQKVHIRINSQVKEATVVETKGPTWKLESVGEPSILVEKYVRGGWPVQAVFWLERGIFPH